MDRELEDIIQGFKDLRSRVSADERDSFDQLIRCAINADTPAQRQEILDALVDPEGVLSRAERDKLIAAAASDELSLRRIRRRKKQQR